MTKIVPSAVMNLFLSADGALFDGVGNCSRLQQLSLATMVVMKASNARPPTLLALPSYLAAQASKIGRRHLEDVLKEQGLASLDHAVLTALDDFGTLSQQQLADSLDLDKSHLVSRIDHMEKRGYLTRAQDPCDRRRHRVELTDSGRTLLERLRPAAEESQRRFLRPLSAPEQQTLTSLLRRVLMAADNDEVER
ncbi:MarR family winged helix-turn-helix transcriptional regulator [Nonomuraea purpurea]|uniref:MarR family winged helix-turn-helix transcriptional regulator n=1 Tax=Nonomuraea purpurea TaxID=1849276 RepID=A0ABV8G6H4_9ACTN